MGSFKASFKGSFQVLGFGVRVQGLGFRGV